MTELDGYLEVAAEAAFRAAQSEYRAEYDRFPITKTWKTTDESVRVMWRAIAQKTLDAALRSFPAVDGVGVKPIEFRAAQHPKRLQAVSIIGAYLVLRRGSKFALERQCGGPADLIGLFDSPDAATAAAQSHFDAAVRSALSPTSSDRASIVEPVAWRVRYKGDARWTLTDYDPRPSPAGYPSDADIEAEPLYAALSPRSS